MTLGDFIDRCVDQHHCRLFEVELEGPAGPVRSRVLSRVNGSLRRCVLPNISDDDELTTQMLASLCNALGIPAFEFGIFIG